MRTTAKGRATGAKKVLGRGIVRGRVRWGVALAVLGLGSAGAGAAPYTGTGGGPETTVNAPYRAGTGQTVPPGRDAAPDRDPTERTERQRRLDGVLDSICETCGDGRGRGTR